MNACWHVLRLDLVAALRGGGAGVPLAFFLLVATLAPIAVGGDPGLSVRISAGVIWLGALLASLLSLDRMFRPDLEDGCLTVFLTAPVPLEALVLAKCLANWLTTGLPVIVAAPVAALLHGATIDSALNLMVALLAGTPSLSLIGGITAALTAGLRAPGVLVPVLAMPLSAPALLFGTVASDPALAASYEALLFLAAFSIAALAFAPFAISAALRQAEQ